MVNEAHSCDVNAVPTPEDPITARAKTDFVAMGKLAKVNIATSDVFQF